MAPSLGLRQPQEILDAYGLGDLSMRRLAERLGVKAGALYWHVANKQSLLAAVSDEILAVDGGPTTVPSQGPKTSRPFVNSVGKFGALRWHRRWASVNRKNFVAYRSVKGVIVSLTKPDVVRAGVEILDVYGLGAAFRTSPVSEGPEYC
jgi:hypothetical protein